MATIKPIIKSTLTPSSKLGDLKRKLEDIDPIDEAEEPKSMICFVRSDFVFVTWSFMCMVVKKYWLT